MYRSFHSELVYAPACQRAGACTEYTSMGLRTSNFYPEASDSDYETPAATHFPGPYVLCHEATIGPIRA